jgi:hypothetical protein
MDGFEIPENLSEQAQNLLLQSGLIFQQAFTNVNKNILGSETDIKPYLLVDFANFPSGETA